MPPSHRQGTHPVHGVDAHAHLDDPAFDADRGAVLAAGRAAGIGTVVLSAGDPAHWERVRRVATTHRLPFTLGVHPWWPDPSALERLPAALTGCVGIGETGLDHHRASSGADRQRQRALLDAHLELALARDLPVVLHCVHAVDAVLDAVTQAGAVRGMLHSYVRGDLDRALAQGLFISFGPDIARSTRAREAALRVPEDRLLLESDAPDRPLHGQRGQPAHVAELAALLAPLRDTTPERLLAATGENARALFRMGPAS